MAKKQRLRPNTIMLWLKILAIVLLLFFPIHALATEFNITVDPEIAKNIKFNAKDILRTITAQVNEDFKYTNTKPVDVIVYCRIGFANALENTPTWTEAAYDGKIHVAIATDQNDFKIITSQIVHEYTHLVVADLTNNNCPRWFNEGLARYEEYRHGMQPHMFLLAAAYSSDLLIPWKKINKQIISTKGADALLAYQQAYSFVYYLVETYGMAKIVQLLDSLGAQQEFLMAIERVYGTSLDILQTKWKIWLGPFLEHWAAATVVE